MKCFFENQKIFVKMSLTFLYMIVAVALFTKFKVYYA